MRHHLAIAMLTGVLAGASVGCTAASSASASGSHPILSVVVQPCGAATPSPYYSVDFTPDGVARIRGQSGVHLLGEHSARAKLGAVARLARVAEAATPASAPRGSYCLQIENARAQQVLIGSESDKAAVQTFERLFRKAVDLRSVICPARHEALGRTVGCARPVIWFSYSERDTCGDFQVVRIYADGQVHHFTARSSAGDSYQRIDRARVARLFSLASKYRGDLIFTGIPASPRHRVLVGADMLREYKQALTDIAGVAWQPLVASDNCPHDQAEYPTGQLTLDRW